MSDLRHRIFRRLLRGALLILGCTASLASFALPLSGEAAARRADSLMARVAHGDFDAAFGDAREWRRPEDAEFDKRLERVHQAVATKAAGLGAPQSAQFYEETHLDESCVQRYYRVRYANGVQDWQLRYRRGSRGWYLYELFVPSAGD